jgi:hypothetical protein
MKRLAVSVVTVAAFLGGCNGATGSAVVPLNSITGTANTAGAPIVAEAKNGELLYASAVVPPTKKLFVFSYPGTKLVATIAVPNQPQGLCADKAGDVFVTTSIPNSSSSYVYEYAHGGTRPIATLADPGTGNGCAVDPVTGNLAVANWYTGSPSDSYGDVAIYSNARGKPTTYVDSKIPFYQWCAYDDNGDLYVDGYNPNHAYPLGELPKGASSFKDVTFDKKLSPSSLQWVDGNLIVANDTGIEGPATLYRVRFSGTKGSVVGSTRLNTRQHMNSWGGEYIVSGSQVAGPSYPRRFLSLWPYPKGGQALRYVHGRGVGEFYGFAISVPPQ